MEREQFLGRVDEQRRWIGILEDNRKATDDARSFLVLIHGIGGMGKTQLTRRLLEIADGTVRTSGLPSPDVRPHVLVDLEVERQRLPDRYPAIEGPSVGTLLYTIEQALCDRLGRGGESAFGEFRDALARILDLVSDPDRVHFEAKQSGKALTPEERKGLENAGVLVAGLAGLPIGGSSIAAGTAVGKGFFELRRRKRRRAGSPLVLDISQRRIDLALDPERVLIREFAKGLDRASKKAGLVVAIDTGEIADRALSAIRDAAGASGSATVWLVAGRFETPADSGYQVSSVANFERAIDNDRLAIMPMSAFNRTLQGAYLESRLGRSVEVDSLVTLDRVTRGIPLALQLVAGMMRGGVSLDEVDGAGGQDGTPNELVAGLAGRFLHHALHQSGATPNALRDDIPAIFALVSDETAEAGTIIGFDLQRRILAALLDVPPENLRERLDELAQRHDFVLGATGRVHQEVAIVFREYLLGADQRLRYAAMHERAVGMIRHELERQADRCMGERMGTAAWRVLAAAVVRHEFWVSNERGIMTLANLLPAALILQPHFARVLRDIALRFYPTASDTHRSIIRGIPRPQGHLDELFTQAKRKGVIPSADAQATSLALTLLHDVEPDRALGPDEHTRAALLELLSASEAEIRGAWDVVVRCLETADSLLPATDPVLNAAIAEHARRAAHRLVFHGPYAYPSGPGLTASRLAVTRSAEDATARRILAIALREGGAREAALVEHDLAIQLNPTDSDAHQSRGITLEELGRFGEALQAYERAISLAPARAYPHANRSRLLALTGRYADAVAERDQAIQLAPRDPTVHVGRGDLLNNLGEYEEALKAAARAIELDRYHVYAHTVLGDALSLLGRYDESLAAYARALEIEPTSPYVRVGHSAVLQDIGCFEEALREAERAIDLSPGRVEFQSDRGEALWRLGRHDDALVAFTAALEWCPNHPDYLTNVAALLAFTDQVDSALDRLTTAVDLDSCAFEAWGLLGVLYRSAGKGGSSANAFEAVLNERGYGVHPYLRAETRAIASACLGDGSQGLEDLRGAAPRPAWAYRPELYRLLDDCPVEGLSEVEQVVRGY